MEVVADRVVILSKTRPLPFSPSGAQEAHEEVRLRYRYLDLRRPSMAANLKARSKAVAVMRRVMDELGFLEVETPTLIASTPEGARDVLVPSRHQKGSFYALPQSPQLFKQLLMVAGVERYYQVAKCYRDEDFRSDRQIEFSQLDFEGSFWDRDDVLDVLQTVVCAVTREVRGVEPATPFPRMTWHVRWTDTGATSPTSALGGRSWI